MHFECLEVEEQVAQRGCALLNDSHDTRADISTDEMEMNRTAAKARKKRSTLVRPRGVDEHFQPELMGQVSEYRRGHVRLHRQVRKSIVCNTDQSLLIAIFWKRGGQF